jgi:CelD/BcsL family acetyltransferase involved in cellulose biosynthesis
MNPELAPTWERLAEASTHATIFQTWEWAWSWWQHFARRARPLILVARDGQDEVGLAPLALRVLQPFGIRRIELLGCGVSDYLDMLTLPGREVEVAERTWAFLEKSAGAWDLIDLQQVPESAPWLENLLRLAAQRGWPARLSIQEICPAAQLPSNWQDFQSSLSKKLRFNLGRSRKLLDKLGPVRVERARGKDAAKVLELLFLLHGRRWIRKGLPGSFASPKVRAFHRQAARELDSKGRLALYYLAVNGRIGAGLYCFEFRDTVFYYQAGFDPGLARYSPGAVILSEAIRRAIESGKRTFDFLRGAEAYKYRWLASDRRNLRLRIGQPSARSRLAWKLSFWQEAAERRVKEAVASPCVPGGSS